MTTGAKLTRAERTAQTRKRMLDAAFATFAESGYHGAWMAEIARRAGVAEPTLYFTFHSKAELLQQVLAHAGAAPSEPATAEQRPWIAAVLDEPDPRRLIALVVENGTDILQRLAPLAETMNAAAISEVAAANVLADITTRRRAAFARIVAAAAARAPLGLPAERAIDIIDVVQSAPTFNAFVVAHGWEVAQFKAWSYGVLTQQLLPLPTLTETRAADLIAVDGLTFQNLIPRDGGPAAT
jgi:AcrR family transcriptional regulator